MKQNYTRFIIYLVVAMACIGLALTVSFSYTSLLWRTVDSLIEVVMTHLHRDWLTLPMVYLSWWGTYGSILLWSGLALYFGHNRNWRMLIMVAVLSLGSLGLGFGLKEVFLRQRPTLAVESTYSMPSNHVLVTIVLYMFITYLFYQRSHRFFRSILLFILCLLLVTAIGLSRLYLGVHFFSDVVSGFMFGLGYLFTVLAVAETLLFLV